MIFVTVGTTPYQLDRLVKAIDELIEKGEIKDRVVAQIGACNYTPKNFEYSKFKPYEEMENLTKKADVVISHAGAGSIMLALEYKKPLIVVPRLEKHGEHVNDHQIEIAKELEKQGKLFDVYDIKNLKNTIEKAKKVKKQKINLKETKIVGIIEQYIKDLEK